MSNSEDTFKVGETSLVLAGTSGVSKVTQMVVEGRPIRHDITVAGQTLVLEGTSGFSPHPQQTAQGQPIQGFQSQGVGVGLGQIAEKPIRIT